MKQEIIDLKNQIRKIYDRIDDIQRSCGHGNVKVSFFQEALREFGCEALQLECPDCGHVNFFAEDDEPEDYAKYLAIYNKQNEDLHRADR